MIDGSHLLGEDAVDALTVFEAPLASKRVGFLILSADYLRLASSAASIRS